MNFCIIHYITHCTFLMYYCQVIQPHKKIYKTPQDEQATAESYNQKIHLDYRTRASAVGS